MWKALGRYLGRVVKGTELSEQPPFQLASLKNSVVLMSLRVAMPSDLIRTLLKSLVDQQPLAVVIYGIGARAAFEMLLSELNDGIVRKHVMTKLSESDDLAGAIEELLYATWPSDDRFSDWAQYAIVSVGGDSRDVATAVKKSLG